ncbi:mitogen-activated protein kinase kinase kinase 2-like [Ylistrum balloti]|uniref:mitogen-activated protein kinase kinase kinase 2-like n=1 Tax=Ylistrum balloti TaxID=509963 RepID=UPI002905BC33|nr:mitogen-activated protein kinase kinase kinase 2-like [Ylistrum balloti]
MDGNPQALKDVMGNIQSQLERGLRMGNPNAQKAAIANLKRRDQTLRIKLEYNGEKRSIYMARPVTYDNLRCKVREMHSMDMNMFFTQANGEMRVPIQKQTDLETAISLVDQNNKITSLRIFLTMPTSPDNRDTMSSRYGPPSVADSAYGSQSYRESPSPPPGSLPHNYNHSVSCGSIHSEGEFIPEDESVGVYNSPEGSLTHSDSHTSLDSSYLSNHGDTYPFRMRSHSRRSISSDSFKDDRVTDYKPVKSGTFPRGFDVSHAPDLDGRMTFPRSGNMSGRRPDIGSSNFQSRSTISRGSEGTLSTSSSSSGLPPDPDMDSPEGRLKRGNDLDSPIYNYSDLSFSKSPRAPSNWKKGHQLGSGSFGEVFVCYDKDSGRELAVKQVSLTQMNAELSKEVRALENEIQLLRNFQHERIVSYFGCHQDQNLLSIFMEYMPGGSIKDELSKYGPLTESVTRKYTRQMLEGLAFLHKNVIVHRDIKAANVLRDLQGNIKLADFGASKRLHTICSATGFKSFVGTPHYMAPEVINGEGYGRKADVWSLGCTVVEMISGKPPWSELESMAAIYKIATAERPEFELPQRTSEFSREFLRLTFRRNPLERPSSEDLLRHRFTAG